MPVVYAVKYVMSRPLITVERETSAHKVITLMVEKNIGAVVVTDKDKPIGIITERDILKHCCNDVSCRRVNVEEIMSAPLITVDHYTPIGAAVELMTGNNVRRLLVTEERKIIVIVTQKDLMRGTLDAFRALDSALSMV